MLPRYHSIFADVAAQVGVWILVRETNDLSFDYMALPEYMGKPFDIKVKTADKNIGIYKVGGLVADPTLPALQGAFEPRKYHKAVGLWNELLAERPPLAKGQASGPYSIIKDPAHKHFGCLVRDGKCIHGDFDLYDIIDPGHPTRNLGLVRTPAAVEGSTHTMNDIIPRHWTRVSQLINGRVGKPMIYHGGDFQFLTNDKKPGHAEDRVDAFGPQREHVYLDSLRSIAAFYGNRFPNRKSMRQSY